MNNYPDISKMLRIAIKNKNNERALEKTLRRGKLGGAALDVFEKEPYDGTLNRLENVFLTPHIGSYAREIRIKMEIDSTKNLINCLKNE